MESGRLKRTAADFPRDRFEPGPCGVDFAADAIPMQLRDIRLLTTPDKFR
jgi:hypothetical protein